MAIYANINIDQGSDFLSVITVEDTVGNVVDLTGFTAAGQIRKTYASSAISATFTTSIAAATGQVTLSLTDTETTNLDAGRYVYDLNINSSSGQKTRVVVGQATVTPGVTR